MGELRWVLSDGKDVLAYKLKAIYEILKFSSSILKRKTRWNNFNNVFLFNSDIQNIIISSCNV